MNEIVILSAAPFEAQALCERLKHLGLSFTYDSFGIGPVQTAWRAPELAQKYARRNIIVVGTAGAFFRFSSLKLVKPRVCKWMPTCAREGIGQLIEGIEPEWDVSQKAALSLNFDDVTVHTSPCITTKTASLIDPNSVENMELYCLKPVFDAAETFDAIFAITNAVGPQGRQQWRENFRDAGELTASQLAPSIARWKSI